MLGWTKSSQALFAIFRVRSVEANISARCRIFAGRKPGLLDEIGLAYPGQPRYFSRNSTQADFVLVSRDFNPRIFHPQISGRRPQAIRAALAFPHPHPVPLCSRMEAPSSP